MDAPLPILERPSAGARPASHAIPFITVFAALAFLTALTLVVGLIRFPSEWVNVLLALTVALVKGGLVAWYFMHLKFEGKLIFAVLVAPLFLCGVILCALVPDVVLTFPASNSASLHVFNAPAVPK